MESKKETDKKSRYTYTKHSYREKASLSMYLQVSLLYALVYAQHNLHQTKQKIINIKIKIINTDFARRFLF